MPRAFLLYLLTALGLTWPLALRAGDHVLRGTEPSAVVNLFNLWSLRWNAERALGGWSRYWDAPIFHPEAGTFALSEAQPLTGVAQLLFETLGLSPSGAFGAVIIVAMALNGLGASALLGALGIGRWPSLLGGLLIQGLPFLHGQAGTAQLLMLFPALFAWMSLVQLKERGAWRDAVGLGLWLSAAVFTCTYYAVFLSLLLPLWALLWLGREGCTRQLALRLGAGLLLASALSGPLLWQQHARLRGFERSDAEVASHSAKLQDYLRPELHAHPRPLYRLLRDIRGNARLHPGFLLVLLAIAGAVLWRRRAPRLVLACVSTALLAVALSLGPNIELWGWRPYALLRAHWPGLEALRSPMRISVFAQLQAALLATFALAWLQERSRQSLRVLAVVAAVFATLEGAQLPWRLAPTPGFDTRTPWVAALAAAEPGAVLQLPLSTGVTPRHFAGTVQLMLASFHFHKPMLNGYSGFFPERFRRLYAALRTFPDADGLALLRSQGVRYLVVEPRWMTRSRRLRFGKLRSAVRTLHRDGEREIYELLPAAGSETTKRAPSR